MERIFFGPFCLDPARGRLTRDGQTIPITPKAFAVLQALAQRPGELITKRELLEAVWPRRCVGDAVLYSPVIEALEGLCSDRQDARALDQLRRWGPTWLFKTSGVVQPEEPTPSVPHHHNRQRMFAEIAGFVEAVASEQPLILVLEGSGLTMPPSTSSAIWRVGNIRLLSWSSAAIVATRSSSRTIR